MSALILIPARLASTRLPDKPLVDICGIPMINRVCALATASGIGRVAVAAGDIAIAECVRSAGYEAVLTDPDLPSGSDRIHAAANLIDSDRTHDEIINLQGDMPTLDPSALNAVLQALRARSDCDIATLAAEITDQAELSDPDIVKAVLSRHHGSNSARALYFSRSCVPAGDAPKYHHIGIYAYKRVSLDRFVASPPSPLEMSEKLEQLRALELGMNIDCEVLDGPPPNGVDTAKDLEAARRFLTNTSPERNT
ncbi:MAG: 3-deoxy-manno-octulosonate cytidylyltransferase [Hyphomonadaceae bacterium]